MNGLQSVPAAAGRRIQCVPICPPGTRGRTLSRRLSNFTPRRPTTYTSEAPTHRHEQRRLASTAPLDLSMFGLRAIYPEQRAPEVRELYQCVATRDLEGVWETFNQIYRDNNALKILRRADYTLMIRAMRPKDYMNVRTRHALTKEGDVVFLSEEEQFQRFYGRITFIVNRMHKFNIRLTLVEYFYLLETARAGDVTAMAERLWNTMAGETRLVFRKGPDTWATNSYMASKCGTGRTDRFIRTSPRTVEMRRKFDKNPLELARSIIGNMKRKGIMPNSMTWELLLLAAARMGELPVIEAVLEKTWGVSITELLQEDPSAAPLVLENDRDPETRLNRGDALYPDEVTLFNISVALGAIGQVALALRIVDHMARRFELTIPRPAWIALLNWTYTWVHTRAYPGKKFLQPNAVEMLWNTLNAPPYSVRPTMEMYDLAVRSFLHRGMPDRAEQIMDRGLVEMANILEARDKAEEDLAELIALEKENPEPPTHRQKRRKRRKESELAEGIRDLEMARAMTRRWVELLVLGKDMQQKPYFAWKRVPDIVEKWGYFLGDGVVYFTKDGYVELDLGEEKRWVPIRLRRRRATKSLGSGSKEEDDF